MSVAPSYDWRAYWSEVSRIIFERVHRAEIIAEPLVDRLYSLLDSLLERRFTIAMIINADYLSAAHQRGAVLVARTVDAFQSDTDIIASIEEAIRKMVSWCSRSWDAIKSFFSWVLNIPHAIISTAARWLTSIKHGFIALFSVVKLFGKVFLLILVGAFFAWVAFKVLRVSWKVLRVIWKSYRQYSAEKARQEQYIRMQREAEARSRRYEEERRQEQEQRERDRAQQQQRERERRWKAAEEECLKREREQRCKDQAERRRSLSDRIAYNDWTNRCTSFLADKQHAVSFPNPPSWPCESCRENEILEACKHTIDRLLRASGKDLRTLLREERIKWHPDKFSVCPPPAGEMIRAKASEMFKIINSLLNE